MSRRKLVLASILALLFLITLNSNPAKATVTTWYVSTTGDNTNDCQTSLTP